MFKYPTINAGQALPEVNISEIIEFCEQAKQGNPVDTGKVLSDICGMMGHIFSKQHENEGLKAKVDANTDRIEQLEAKVGDPQDVAYPRTIAIRKLHLPPLGVERAPCHLIIIYLISPPHGVGSDNIITMTHPTPTQTSLS